MLEGHVGVSAPDEIAVAYSRYRAQIVGQILEDEYGVDASRIESRGWGYDVSRIAQQSEHPSASAAKAGYGWVELFFRANPCPHHAPTIVPPIPDYYDGAGPPSTQADVGFVGAIHRGGGEGALAVDSCRRHPRRRRLRDPPRAGGRRRRRLPRLASDYFPFEEESIFGADLGEGVFHPRRGRPTSSAAFTAALAATFCVGVALSWCSASARPRRRSRRSILPGRRKAPSRGCDDGGGAAGVAGQARGGRGGARARRQEMAGDRARALEADAAAREGEVCRVPPGEAGGDGSVGSIWWPRRRARRRARPSTTCGRCKRCCAKGGGHVRAVACAEVGELKAKLKEVKVDLGVAV